MMKIKEPAKILSLVPGTKYLGVALFYGTELRDWRIKVLNIKKDENRLRKAKEIILDFMQSYEPQVFAIKKLNPKRSSKKLNNLAGKIKEFVKRKGLSIQQMELSEIKESISSGRRINKKELSQLMVLRFPELFFEFEKEKKNKKIYYERVFEAVALGLACFYKVDKKHGKK